MQVSAQLSPGAKILLDTFDIVLSYLLHDAGQMVRSDSSEWSQGTTGPTAGPLLQSRKQMTLLVAGFNRRILDVRVAFGPLITFFLGPD